MSSLDPKIRHLKVLVGLFFVSLSFEALMDLDGRFFAGRTVRADYYSELAFDAQEYQNA